MDIGKPLIEYGAVDITELRQKMLGQPKEFWEIDRASRVKLAGQAGLTGHIRIGDGATVGAQGGVTKSVPADTVWSGYPAREHLSALRQYAALIRLPGALDELRRLAERVAVLESGSDRETSI